jgi:hypothetical protein
MTQKKLSDAELDRMLAALDDVPEPSSDLLGRVLGDAYDLQPEASVATPAQEEPRFGLLNIFGGWLGLGGLVTAASVGFLVGFNPPSAMDASLTVWLGLDSTVAAGDAPVTGFGWDIEEG